MHEIAIANSVLENAIKAGATKYIKALVGELSEITPSELQEALEKLTLTTLEKTDFIKIKPLSPKQEINQNELGNLTQKSWKIIIEFEQSKIQCNCGYKGKANIIDKGHGYCIYDCPNCHKNPKVLEGGSIKIIEIE